jgi:hypothetical protein
MLVNSADWIKSIDTKPAVIHTNFLPIYELGDDKFLELKSAYNEYLDGDMKILFTSIRDDRHMFDKISIKKHGLFIEDKLGSIEHINLIQSLDSLPRINTGHSFDPDKHFRGALMIYDVENDKVIYKRDSIAMTADDVKDKLDKFKNKNVVIILSFATNNQDGFADPLFSKLKDLGGDTSEIGVKTAPYVYFFVASPTTGSAQSFVHYPIDNYPTLNRAYITLRDSIDPGPYTDDAPQVMDPNKVRLKGSSTKILWNVWEWAHVKDHVYQSNHLEVKKKQVEDYLQRLSHNCTWDVELTRTSSGYMINPNSELICPKDAIHEPDSGKKIT